MRKGQLQIQETILVVFIFIVLIALGLVFFYRFQLQSIQSEIQEYEHDHLSTLLVSLPESPEFSCSFRGEKGHCLDTFKLLAFSEVSGKDSSFFQRFGYMNISVYSLYPSSSVPCSSSQFNSCGVWTIYSRLPEDKHLILGKEVLDSPVSLYFPDTDSYGVGLLVVEVYGR